VATAASLLRARIAAMVRSEVLQRGEKKGAEFSSAAIHSVQVIPFQNALKEGLSEIFRIVYRAARPA